MKAGKEFVGGDRLSPPRLGRQAGWILSPPLLRVARASQPWLEDSIPLGLKYRTANVHEKSKLDVEIHELVKQAEAVARIAVRKSQRDFALQPKVARNELPWVNGPTNPQPQRGCVNLSYAAIPVRRLHPFRFLHQRTPPIPARRGRPRQLS